MARNGNRLPRSQGRAASPPSSPARAEPRARGSVSRRDFFKLTAIGGGAMAALDGCSLFPFLTPSFSANLVRREDLVTLRFDFVNLSLTTGADGGQEIVPNGGGSAFIIVNFQPQHIFEHALQEVPPPVSPPKPVDARIAGGSRVVLIVPPEKTPIAFTGEALLAALGSLQMNTAPNALPPPAPLVVLPVTPPVIISGGVLNTRAVVRTRQMMAAGQQLSAATGTDVSGLTTPAGTDVVGTVAAAAQVFPLPPGLTLQQATSVIDSLVSRPRPRLPLNGETAIELPFRLEISPNSQGGWAHNNDAETGKKLGRYELWHTRLGVRDASTGAVNEGPSYLKTMRAIWTRDPGFNPAVDVTTPLCNALDGVANANPVADASLTASWRAQIVQQSSNFRDFGSYTPKAAQVNRLMLTSLGGWLDSHDDFTVTSPLTVTGWDHKASMGRDYFVKITEKGRLYPWGHFALKITITERKFRGPDPATAYLWQRKFIVVTEPTRTYPAAWRKLPFASVTVRTLVTPNLDIPFPPPASFVVQTGPDAPFRFKLDGVDVEGNLHKFDGVAVWTSIMGTNTLFDVDNAASLYAALSDSTHRRSGFDGQRVAYSLNKRSDDTTYETDAIVFGGTKQSAPPPGVTFPSVGIPFLPHVDEAQLNVEAIRHLVGQDAPTAFQYADAYLQHGFPDIVPGSMNPGELLMQLKNLGSPIGLDFSKKSDASGGFLAPSLDIKGLSRITGPIAGDLTDAASNTFDPSKFLGSVNALVFGVIPLADIIKGLGGLASAPQFVTQTVDAVTGFIEDIAELKARIEKAIDDLVAAGKSIDAALTNVKNKINDVAAAVQALLSADDVSTAVTDTQALISSLESLLDALIGVALALPSPPLMLSVKKDLQSRAKKVKDVLDEVNGVLDKFARGLDLAKNLTVKLDWRAPLGNSPGDFFVPDKISSGDEADGGFILSVEARGKQVGDKPPGVDVIAGLEKFKVNVFGSAATLVTIPFEHLIFEVKSGQKPDVDVKFKGDGVGFDGVLAFVETLSKLIPGGGFSDPPSLSVSAEGIKAAFSVAIPSVSVGVFSIENISLGAGFEVPFIGNPLSVSFNFCTRDEPFVMTVMCIGGGGFFGVKLSPHGLLLLEAALEARAELSLDLGVASGSVSIAVGVYFRLEEVGGMQQGHLTGYFKIHGEVDVLGIITASITLLLELTYEFSSGKLVGKATLTIEVSICFFSFSVEVSVERKLAGSGSDPTFADQMSDYLLPDGNTAHPWADYLGSFLLAA
jgi:hypothetical protein